MMLGLLDLPLLPSLPHIAAQFGFDPATAIGLSLATAIGLLAWHIATLTVPPRPSWASGSIAAALLPALLIPGLGFAALLPALALSFARSGMDRRQRIVALLVQCGAALALLPLAFPSARIETDGFLLATMAFCCGLSFICAVPRAANDNPLLKRPLRTAWFYASDGNVSFAPIQSGEVGSH
ncbi:hypothetical protein [Sphingomonas sp. LT1P40]|uniref:hypothetical protein n=1 Tax=Alteristakelama amylovorans TaxID=3096166 RepID=UPI002FC846C7